MLAASCCWFWVRLTVELQIVCCHQDFQAELDGNVHIWHVLSILVLVPVVKILHDLLQNLTTGKLSVAESHGTGLTMVMNAGASDQV